ncbi:MAG: isoprenyl transferase [Ruminococcus sp.]|nr:isoprenyl transferase [Ruminococcus sp.]
MAKDKNEARVLIPPVHVGVIMDGNGRWAKKRGMPRKFGHRAGAKTFRRIVRHAKHIGIKYITFYAFSTENWKRSEDEVNALMKLFEKNLDDLDELFEENVRIRFIGDRTKLSYSLRKRMEQSERESLNNTAMTLVIAINYGGRDEITNAVRTIAQDVRDGKLDPADVSEELIQSRLYTEEMPPVDLIIRPSGELRLSNFMIWQAAYAEYYFTDILWPDFSNKDLEKAVEVYCERNRRFGGV